MGLCLFLTDGRVEMDNNTVERTIRPIALNRKNALFAGHDAGAANWATIASLVETCGIADENRTQLAVALHRGSDPLLDFHLQDTAGDGGRIPQYIFRISIFQ